MNVSRMAKPLAFGMTATAITGMLGAYLWHETHRPQVLEVYVFGLTSGRSMFIRTPEDHRILVDGGRGSEIIARLSAILPFYSRRIDTIIATNADPKNITGLIDVLQRYTVDRVYIPALASSTDDVFDTFLATAAGETLNGSTADTNDIRREVRPLMAADHLDLDRRTTFTTLFPVPFESFSYSHASAPELLFRLDFEKTSLTFLGDATVKVQKFLASTTAPQRLAKTDVVVVSYNPIPGRMARSALERLDPDYLIYSRTLAVKTPTMTSARATMLNVKEKGLVKITSNGETFEVQ